ncbi:hypothetical protein NL676_021397 [Syzygium grande]|nr:hypothetical protein NL676_021397 [Syzygium grande]
MSRPPPPSPPLATNPPLRPLGSPPITPLTAPVSVATWAPLKAKLLPFKAWPAILIAARAAAASARPPPPVVAREPASITARRPPVHGDSPAVQPRFLAQIQW